MAEEASEPGVCPVLHSVHEAAGALGIGRSLLYELLAAGEIASVSIGRRRLIPADALAACVERLRREAT
jgi:excisionase family DNA binding protein